MPRGCGSRMRLTSDPSPLAGRLEEAPRQLGRTGLHPAGRGHAAVGYLIQQHGVRLIGYLIQQHGVRLSRPVKAYDRWARQMPAEYSRSVLGDRTPTTVQDPQADAHCIATVKHYRSLVPLAQDARKPIFSLSAGDGALGSHAAAAARGAFGDFKALVENLLQRTRAAAAGP